MVIDNSKIVRDRISTLVGSLPDVHVNSFDLSEYKYGHACDTENPNVVIISSEDASSSCLAQFENLKKDNPELLGIVLSNKPYKEHEKKWKNAGAEFYFDKSTEFQKILNVCDLSKEFA